MRSCASTSSRHRRSYRKSDISRSNQRNTRRLYRSSDRVARNNAKPRGLAETRGDVGLARRHRKERIIGTVLLLCSAVSILTTLGIVGVLLLESTAFFSKVSILEFLTGTQWTPL